MKKLYLIRHAKSDWSDTSLNDFDRPLNKRGKNNAPLMGKILYERDVLPDLIISSPAKRAKTTAKLFAKEVDYKKENIKYIDTIYEASVNELINVIKECKDKVDTLFLFGHNPSLNMLAELLVGFEENIPTAAFIEIEIDSASWSDIEKAEKRLVSFEYPKKYSN